MNNNRKGISNVVATIILIAVAIALAVAVAVWVFGLAGSASKTATLTLAQASLTGITSGTPTLTFMVDNPSGTSITLSGFALGDLTCIFNSTTPLVIPGGASGQLKIQFSTATSGSATFNNGNTVSFTCTGSQTFVPGVQYSGYLATTSGQTYPFTVTASS